MSELRFLLLQYSLQILKFTFNELLGVQDQPSIFPDPDPPLKSDPDPWFLGVESDPDPGTRKYSPRHDLPTFEHLGQFPSSEFNSLPEKL